jgi:hypothetical protein
MMVGPVSGVLAGFDHVDAAVEAVRTLKARGHGDLTVYSAAPNHELDEALGHPVSGVRLFTLIGALSGCVAGYAMTTWMSYDWPLLVGGKPIAAFPPYVVIMFELTILLGALSTVAGIIILSLRRSLRGRAFDPRFTDDRIGVFVPCSPGEANQIRRILESAGAAEVTHAG